VRGLSDGQAMDFCGRATERARQIAREQRTALVTARDRPLRDQQIARGAVLGCPECGARAELSQGDELVLDRIEMEVA